MSILIKGMTMPETCDECRFHQYHGRGEYVCAATPMFYPANLANSKGIIKNWCPLVELPAQHGRLIDARNLEARAFRYLLMNGEESPKVVFAQAIKDATTIIEAEGGADD